METPQTHCHATATVTLLWKRYQGPNMSHYIYIHTYIHVYIYIYFTYIHYIHTITVINISSIIVLKSSPTTHLYRLNGERMYSSYSFKTSALDGGEWSASRPGRALPPREGSPRPIGQEAGWAPEQVWTQRLDEKSSCLYRESNLDQPVVQSVVTHYND
jgi:hypothetical protein